MATPIVERIIPYRNIDRIEENFVSSPDENRMRLRLIKCGCERIDRACSGVLPKDN